MKKTSFARSLAVLLGLVLLCGCAATAPSFGAPASGGTPAAQPAGKNDTFYPAAGADSAEDPAPGAFQWEQDGSIVVQNKNRLLHLSPENELLETVTLDGSLLPGEGYSLCWNDSRVLALAQQGEDSAFAAACLTEQGEVFLVNLCVFDRQGALLRRFPEEEVYGYDASGNYHLLAVSETGKPAADYSALAEPGRIFWLDGDRAVFNCQDRILLYDFAADTGRVLDELSGWMDGLGEEWVYYGADAAQSGMLDGAYYYLLRHPDQPGGALWRADASGVRQISAGPFSLLFVGRDALLAAGAIDPADGSRTLLRIDPETGAAAPIWEGVLNPDLRESGRITFCNAAADAEIELFSYDPAAGALDRCAPGDAFPSSFFSTVEDGRVWFFYTLQQGGALTEWACPAGGEPVPLAEGSLGRIGALRPDGLRVFEYETVDRLARRVSPLPAVKKEA